MEVWLSGLRHSLGKREGSKGPRRFESCYFRMKKILIPKRIKSRAEEKAIEMGGLRDSILGGEGNAAGFLGEAVVARELGGRVSNSFDYDIKLPNGQTVDVKTKQTTVVPRNYYDCSIAALNIRQECDYYAFVRVNMDLTVAWFLGVKKKEDYLTEARFLKKGTIDGDNNFIVRSDCFNLPISDLEMEICQP